VGKHLIIRNNLSPGDYVVLSSAVRDLHRCYPGEFHTQIEVPQKAVFLANPYNVRVSSRAKVVRAAYPLVQRSNQERAHFMWGFIEDLNKQLDLKINLTEFRPDLYLTDEEKREPLYPKPYWVFASGGKKDYTAKWWEPVSWERVVADLGSKVPMVQVGAASHVHPKIKGAVDMVGKTSYRDLMRLIYHSEGVLCIVTCLMHVAAAFNKPCVVLGGGREPWWWEAYDERSRILSMTRVDKNWKPPANDDFIPHRFIDTMDQLPCCMGIGCWRSQVDGPGKSNCHKTVVHNGTKLPMCMQMITPERVLQEVDWYYQKGILTRNPGPVVLYTFGEGLQAVEEIKENGTVYVEVDPRDLRTMPYLTALYSRMPGNWNMVLRTDVTTASLDEFADSNGIKIHVAEPGGKADLIENTDKERVLWLDSYVMPKASLFDYAATLPEGKVGGVHSLETNGTYSTRYVLAGRKQECFNWVRGLDPKDGTKLSDAGAYLEAI
jgi:ADP-heptose:LPS heptosyltransferase